MNRKLQRLAETSFVTVVEIEWNPLWWRLKPIAYKHAQPNWTAGIEWLFFGLSIEIR